MFVGQNENLNVLRKYVELSFEFNIWCEADWPYSNKFWSAGLNKRIDNVEISLGGTAYLADIIIKMNNVEKPVVEKYNLSVNFPPYNW